MDIIKRRICLENFISRTNTKWGYENGSWGKIAYDIAIPEHCPLFNINNKLPMIDNIDIKSLKIVAITSLNRAEISSTSFFIPYEINYISTPKMLI